MINISGFGFSANVVASNTFPAGFNITEWADDADSVDSPDLEIADSGMGLNGDFVVWNRPVPTEVTMSVIPTSDADKNLLVLAQANRTGKNKRGARDLINLVITYPNGQVVTLENGVMVSAPMLNAIASAGRFKSHSYKFRFENVTSVNA